MTFFLWPRSQNYKFEKKNKKFSKLKLSLIENFFLKKYNANYCALVPSARVGIILCLKFKNFNKSKIVQLPRWSSNCLVNAVGSLSSINSKGDKTDCKILVHHLGQTFKLKKSKSLIIDDSSDSLPNDNFISCKKSKYSEVVSLPKIIGSYAGGIVLTNNKDLYAFIKKQQDTNLELAHEQSLKKYKCIIKNTGNFDWYHNEVTNFGLDFNTINNIYINLFNFEINKEIILRRKKIFSNHCKFNDKYRLGSCLIFSPKKKIKKIGKINKISRIYHFNILKNIDDEKFRKKLIFPIHFTVNEKDIDQFFNSIN